MSTLVVVQNDKVEGTDKHNVTGDAENPDSTKPPIPNSKWVAKYDYKGKMTDQLSDFVSIDGQPVSVKTSKSSLNPGEDVAPAGAHSGPTGKEFMPEKPPPYTPTKPKLIITDTVGEGNPSADAGSTFVRIDGTAILLDGDSIDTCDGLGGLKNSTVTVENQDFVSCSE